jgi:YD repeat-containing protein
MKKILLLAFTASVILSACKKDKNDDPETLPTCANISVKEDGNTGTSVIRFDEQGRVKESNSNNYASSYQYQSDKIIFTESYPGVQNATITFTLDAQGRVIEAVDSDGTTNYEYNNDGYLTKSIDVRYGSTATETYTWQSGNLVKIDKAYGTTGSTPETSSSTITYGSDIITDKRVAGSVFGELYSHWELHQYFGKQPKNAPTRENDNGDYNNYIYIKDAKGSITGFKMTKDSEATPWWEYSVDYNCK